MKILTLRISANTQSGFVETNKIFSILLQDKFFIKNNITLSILVEKKFISILLGIPNEKVNFVKSIFRNSFPEIEFDDYQVKQNTNIYYNEICLSKNVSLPFKNQSDLDSNLLAIIIGVLQESGSDTCGISINYSLYKKSLFEKIFGTKKDASQNIKPFIDKSTYVRGNICIFSEKDSPQLQSNISSALKLLSIKYQNEFIIKSTKIQRLESIFSGINNKKVLYLLSELHTFVHIPDPKLLDFSFINSTKRKIIPPQKNICEHMDSSLEVTYFANTTIDNSLIGLTDIDRLRHTYIIGKSGTRKTKLLQNIILGDILRNKACIFIDPHGESSLELLKMIPKEMVANVIYLDFSDTESFIGFNPIEVDIKNEFPQKTIDGFISIFKKVMINGWSDSLEYILRMSLLALMEADESKISNIIQLLTNSIYRRKITEKVKNDIVKDFWSNSFLSIQDKKSEEINRLVNSLYQLISNTSVKNCLDQKNSAFSIENIILNRKILIINLSIGKLGEWTSAFLGSVLITKIWQSIINLNSDGYGHERPLYLFIDEFQNFATETFINIFSEARKYGLGMVVANQYISQIPESIKKSLFGNIGSLISLRLGAEDANTIAREFYPEIQKEDLMNLAQRELYMKISVNGQTSRPFSALSLPIWIPEENYCENIIQNSRLLGKSISQLTTQNQTNLKVEPEFNTFISPILN